MCKATSMKIVKCLETGRFRSRDKSRNEGEVFWEGEFKPIQYFLDNHLIAPEEFHYVWVATGDQVEFCYGDFVGTFVSVSDMKDTVSFLMV